MKLFLAALAFSAGVVTEKVVQQTRQMKLSAHVRRQQLNAVRRRPVPLEEPWPDPDDPYVPHCRIGDHEGCSGCLCPCH